MKVSFDFDDTLSEPHIQAIAIKHVAEGHEVYITTARYHDSTGLMAKVNSDLFAIAESVGISREKIRFTAGNLKNKWLEGFDRHYDDSSPQLHLIREGNKEIELYEVMYTGEVRSFGNIEITDIF